MGVPMHETATSGEGTVPMTGSHEHGSTTAPAQGAVNAGRRRRRPRLRGWGGVGAMAGACALALVATLTLTCGGGRPAGAGVPETGVGVAQARPASSDSCTHPEASLRPSSASGPAVRAIQQRGYLTVGVDQDSYLWGYRDTSTGQIVGFDIDLVKAIATNILGPNPKIVYKTVPTDQRIPAIQHHEVDMVIRTMSITCDRLSQVAFSTAYFEAGQQLLVPKTGTTITGFNDSLRGKTVCTASGSTGLALLKQDPHGAHIMQLANQIDCLVQLQLHQADAVLTDNALAAGQAAQDPTVHLIGTPLTHEPYGVAMNLGDTDLVRRVNAVLNSYRSSGAWMAAYHKWLAHDLPGISGPPQPLYKD
jgi:polar amino acid transport system substrate-binding protein